MEEGKEQSSQLHSLYNDDDSRLKPDVDRKKPKVDVAMVGECSGGSEEEEELEEEEEEDDDDDDDDDDDADMECEEEKSPLSIPNSDKDSSTSSPKNRNNPSPPPSKTTPHHSDSSPSGKRKWREFETAEDYEKRKRTRHASMNYLLDISELLRLYISRVDLT